VTRRHADLAATLVLAAIGATVVTVVPGLLPLRVTLALPLLLVLPGYSLTTALFPHREIDRSRRLLLSVALSLSLAVVIGLVLNLTPFGLRSPSWAAALLIVTSAASTVAFVRRQRRVTAGPVARVPPLRPRDAVFFLAAACILGGAVAFARVPLPAKKVQGYTVLWLLPGSRGEAAAVRVGVTSGELEPVTYRLVVRVGSRVHQQRLLELRPGDAWEESVRVGTSPSGRRALTEALLYREDQPQTVYRAVRLWPSKKTPRS
jgi:uncharacterized membrane protein